MKSVHVQGQANIDPSQLMAEFQLNCDRERFKNQYWPARGVEKNTKINTTASEVTERSGQ